MALSPEAITRLADDLAAARNAGRRIAVPATALSGLDEVIAIHGLAFTYPDGHKALDGVDLVLGGTTYDA